MQGLAGCCCAPHDKLTLTIKAYKITRTRTVTRTQTRTKSAKIARRAEDPSPDVIELDPVVVDNPVESRHELTKRNLCTVCPLGVQNLLVSPEEANRFCCLRRKTVTKTFGRATTVTKRVTKTITSKPNSMINLQLSVFTAGPTPGSLIPLANTPITLYSGTTQPARALTVLARTKTNSTGQASVSVAASTANTIVSVFNALTNTIISSFTVPSGGGSVSVSPNASSQSSTAAVVAGTTLAPIPVSTTRGGSTTAKTSTQKLTSSTHTTTRYRPECALGGGVSYAAGTLLAAAGSGDWGSNLPGTSLSLSGPSSVAMGIDGHIYVADTAHHIIRRINMTTGIMTTITGTGKYGALTTNGGPATSSQISRPITVVSDPNGNFYISEQTNHRISKLTPDGTGGYTINVFAGNGTAASAGDGLPAVNASLNKPWGLALRLNQAGAAEALYISEEHSIRMVNFSSGIMSRVAGKVAGFGGDGGPASNDSAVKFIRPTGLAIYQNKSLLISDSGNWRIRKIDFDTGLINTVWGDGGAVPGECFGISVADNNTILVAVGSSRIRSYNFNTSVADVVAGTGSGGFSGDGGAATSAQIAEPYGVMWTRERMFIADTTNNRIRVVNQSTGIIETLAGTGKSDWGGDGGKGVQGQLAGPMGIYVDQDGRMTFTEFAHGYLRTVDPSGILSTIAGTGKNSGPPGDGDGGPGTSAMLSAPQGITKAGNLLYWAENFGTCVRAYSLDNGTVFTPIGTCGSNGSSGDGGPATAALVNQPRDVKVSRSGIHLLIADTYNHAIRKYNLQDKTISTVAGTLGSSGFSGDGGPATSAKLHDPFSVADDGSGQIFIADNQNCVIRKVAVGGTISTIAGQHGNCTAQGDNMPASSVSLAYPASLATDKAGNIYFGDQSSTIRRIDGLTGTITTVVGNGTADRTWPFGASSRPGVTASSATIYGADGIFVDDEHSNLYFVDYSQSLVMVVLGEAC